MSNRPPPPNPSLPFQRPRLRPISVSALTRDLKHLIEGHFPRVAVEGEISNFTVAASGHAYFTLKDERAAIGAVLFRADLARLQFRPANGMSVCAEGRLSLYEPRGQYQLVCDRLAQVGLGNLAQAFEALKARLLAEGLFEAGRKRPIPFLPTRIGLITSPSGAAVRDFLRILHDRFPLPVLIAPSSVQGEAAPRELASALRRLEASGLVDVIVLTRGGGSIEDLWAFNDESLARAIAACRVPVISAVGHEVDFTIADFVADLRCATPTDAAKTLAPVEGDLRRDLRRQSQRLSADMRGVLSEAGARLHARGGKLGDPRHRIARRRLDLAAHLDRLNQMTTGRIDAEARRLSALTDRLGREHPRARLARSNARLSTSREALRRLMTEQKNARRALIADRWTRLRLAAPTAQLRERRAQLGRLDAHLRQAMRERLRSTSADLRQAVARLDALSPFGVLARGYALAYRTDGRLLRSAADARPGEAIDLLLSDRSRLTARVEGPSDES